ncbi:mediator of RNA polymerase II transcription subunit 8 [Aspergillus nomiae NRRL 13137]|uniref:Mediator of RNA polymerase II transcription subunit 8 n=1 Tax=Aspergillus nomiae NRRL (strain ATCC 15546 / NRRL 13137 / CBS 260.88 / M93) TaxID=1509407 RepID=A0A0L1IUG3_ASPN3|nr:mediator of RNA polymerase II transcription subunit 8 [Aspergillus nomiae NRRL 13137]KNG83050.1 mediator of RNA polymerase II transcription subunit 8 [Aspergillus nomiae NRRL 13137]
MATPTHEQLKTLEQSRQRLVQLTRSLASLIGSLNQSDPLPSWSSLQSQASIISNNLLSVSDHLSDNRELLTSLVAYPGPDYPGRTQANTLEQLLRTKLDPRVEDWVARGRKAGASALEDKSAGGGGAGGVVGLGTCGGERGGETQELGVLEDEGSESEDEEEGEDDEMEIVGVRRQSAGAGFEFDIAPAQHHQQKFVEPAVPLEDILRFMTTGAEPGKR